jgi:ligand-binding sensor domain-containing protein
VLKNIVDKAFKIFVNKHSLLFSLLFFIAIVSIKAQSNQLRFKHYTTLDGLSEDAVVRITRDSRGFVWFSTADGLNRFDGYNFKIFKPVINDSFSIAGDRINSIVEDKRGVLWVGSNEALNRYDYKTDRFEHFYVCDSLHKKLKVYYEPFFIDDKDELWFIYSTNLASINLVTKKITTYPFANSAMEGFTTVDYPAKKLYKHLSKISTTGNSGLHIPSLMAP